MGLFDSWLMKWKLGSADRARRLEAVAELRALPAGQALDLLGVALADEDAEVATAAARALASFRSREALERLERAIRNVLFALAAPPTGDSDRRQERRIADLVDALEEFGPAAADLLIRVLENRDAQLASGRSFPGAGGANRAAALLGQMRFARAESALLARLKDPDASVRLQCATALGELRARAALAPLTATLADSQDIVREAAAEALGRLGDRSAIGPLEARLKDDSTLVRQGVESALGRLGWTPATSEQRAHIAVAHGDLEAASEEGPGALRALLGALWDAYGIQNKQTNDVGGITRHLKNRMTRMELRFLPERESVEKNVEAIASALAKPGRDLPRTEIQMIAALPDLRARYKGQVEVENYHTGHESLRDFEGDTEIRCEAVRKRAQELLAADADGSTAEGRT